MTPSAGACSIPARAGEEPPRFFFSVQEATLKEVILTPQGFEKLRAEIALLESARDRFESEFRTTLAGYMDWIDKRRRHIDLPSELPHEVVAKAEVA